MTVDWHLDADELERYSRGLLRSPALWSVEAHLSACSLCREQLATSVARPMLERGWRRLDASLDVPRPGVVEWVLLRIGVPEQIARLLAATPALRLSWLSAVAMMLVLAVGASWISRPQQTPLYLLILVPLLAVAGIAAAFGPRVDPTHEIGLVAPFDTLRLVLLRASAVLTVTVLLAGAATLALPDAGLNAAVWLVPSLLLTIASLGLSSVLGPTTAAAVTALAWLLTLATTVRLPAGTSVLFHAPAQTAMGVAAFAAAIAVATVRGWFDTHQSLLTTGTFDISRRLDR